MSDSPTTATTALERPEQEGVPERTFAPGALVRHYEITGFVGAGGMGEVYRARDVRLDREVAIKVLPRFLAADAEMQLRLAREARAAAAISHPGVVTIYEFGTFGDRPFVAMELLHGTTLRTRLLTGPLPRTDAVRLMTAVADAVGAAHRRGITHRDLKPDNVFLLPDGGVRVLDFGLARWKAVAVPATTVLPSAPNTRPGEFLGTLGYAAPEQLNGEPVEARADVFALGCTLLETVTGMRPFDGDSVAAMIGAVMSEEPRELSGLASRDPDLAAVVRRALAKRACDRYVDADELAAALRSLVQPSSASGEERTPSTSDTDCDVAILGDAPAGHIVARRLAGASRRVVLIVPPPRVLTRHEAMIGRRAMLEAFAHWTRRPSSHFALVRPGSRPVSMETLTAHARRVIESERLLEREALRSAGVTVLEAIVRSRTGGTVVLEGGDGPVRITASRIVLAPEPHARARVADQRIWYGNDLLHLHEVPRELVIIGAGVEGIELASLFNVLGARVTVVDREHEFLSRADEEASAWLHHELQRRGIALHLGEEIRTVTCGGGYASVAFTGGRVLTADAAIWTGGWIGPEPDPSVAETGAIDAVPVHRVEADNRPDGFVSPVEQAQVVVADIVGQTSSSGPARGYAVYAIPEAAGVGVTEQALRSGPRPYEVGVARYAALGRAQMIGDDAGLLKLLFDPDSLRILGAHIVGARATELVYIAAAIMQLDGTLLTVRDLAFSQPSFAEGYMYAALDGLARVGQHARLTARQ